MQNIIYLQQSNPYLFPILLLLAVLGLLIFVIYTVRKNRLVKLLNSDLLNNEYRLKELEEKVESLSSELNINRENIMALTADKKGLETLIEEKNKSLDQGREELASMKSEYYELQSIQVKKEKLISELNTTLETERQANLEKLAIL